MHHQELSVLRFDHRLAKGQKAFADFIVIDSEKNLYAAHIIQEKEKNFFMFLSFFQEKRTGTFTKYRNNDIGSIVKSYFYINETNSFQTEITKNGEMQSTLFVHKSIYFDPKDNQKEKPQLILCENRNIEDEIFDVLMDRYSIPIDVAWKKVLIQKLYEKKYIKALSVFTYVNQRSIEAALIEMTEDQLQEVISNGIKDYSLNFALIRDGRTDEEAILPSIQHLDEYMNAFSNDLAKIIQNQTETRFDPSKDRHSPAFVTVNRTANQNGLTGLYPPQADVVMAAVATLKKEKFAMVIAEPGCGKTPIGALIPYVAESEAIGSDQARPYRALVMAPAKVLQHWKTQILNRIPHSNVHFINRWEDCIPLRSQPKVPKQIEYYLISTNACADSYPIEPIPTFRNGKQKAIEQKENQKQITYLIEKKLPYTTQNMTSQTLYGLDPIGGFSCPDCHQPLIGRKQVRALPDFFIQSNKTKQGWSYKTNDINYTCQNRLTEDVAKKLPKRVRNRFDFKEQRSHKCNASLWGAVHKPFHSLERKVSPAWYINKHLPRGFFKFLVVDEVHEMKAADSDRATAFGQLVNHATKKILLTGTLVGGMARDIFYLLARLDSRRLKRENITFRDKAKFIERYGANEIIEVANSSIRKIERPGISPLVFTRFLINNCIFLELSNLGYTMQPYSETPVFVDLPHNQRQNYNQMEEQLSGYMGQGIFNGNMSMLSKYLITMQVYCDHPFDLDSIYYNQKLLYSPVNEDKQQYYNPKFEKLKEMIDEQISRGRKTMVYVRFSGRYKVDNYLYDKLKALGYKVGILKSTGSLNGQKFPNEENREQWLRDMQKEHDWDVLITNYELVKVGMNLLMYPTIVFYQMDYNTYTYMQASRRSWRIGQTQPVEVYNLVYENTIQSDILNAVAKKMDAALTIQGKFSEEGIRAMAEATDGIANLAKRLVKEGRLDTNNSIEQRWKAINNSRIHMQDVKLTGYEHYTIETMNPLGIEAIRQIAKNIQDLKSKEFAAGAIGESELQAYFNQLENVLLMVTEEEVNKYNKMVHKKNRIDEGQVHFSF